MKIKDANSAKFFKKCLAAKQLESYAGLCKIMQDFKKLNISEDLLNTYLPSAAEGDLSFLVESPVFKSHLEKLPNRSFKERLVNDFKNYAKFSQIYSDFKYVDEQFNSCLGKTSDGTIQFSKNNFKRFENSINNSDMSKTYTDFYNNFGKHSHGFLGWEHSKIASNALNSISVTHPKKNIFEAFSKITPESFDANIRGFYKPKSHKKLVDDFSKFEDKKPNKLLESIYTNTLGSKFTASSGTLKRVAGFGLSSAGIALILTLSPLESPLDYITKFNQTTIENAQSEGYNLQITDSTKKEIETARKTLETLKNLDELPSVEQLNNMRDILDNNMDLIFSDLVKKAVENKKPDWTVNNVETAYDTTLGRTGDSSYSITFEYTDKDGETKTQKIDTLKDGNFLAALIDKNVSVDSTFSAEIALDQQYPELMKKYNEANGYSEKGKVLTEILDFFEQIQAKEETVGAKEITYKDGLLSDSFKLDLPEKSSDEDAR